MDCWSWAAHSLPHAVIRGPIRLAGQGKLHLHALGPGKCGLQRHYPPCAGPRRGISLLAGPAPAPPESSGSYRRVKTNQEGEVREGGEHESGTAGHCWFGSSSPRNAQKAGGPAPAAGRGRAGLLRRSRADGASPPGGGRARGVRGRSANDGRGGVRPATTVGRGVGSGQVGRLRCWVRRGRVTQ